MSVPFVYPIHAGRGPLAERVLGEAQRAGARVWAEGEPAAASAVLLLAGAEGGDFLPPLMKAMDAGRPVRAAVLNDGGARLVNSLRLWTEAFDFRAGFSPALGQMVTWLIDLGVAAPGAAPVAAEEPPKVFISHPGEDREFVLGLVQLLDQNGWMGWSYQREDQRDYGAVNWQKELNTRLVKSVGVICVLSSEWLVSDDCQNERLLATELHKPLIHLRLRPFDPYLNVSAQQYIDVGGNSDWLYTLLGALKVWKKK
jgi:TIR domain